MSLVGNGIKGIMLVSGAATCTMVYAAIAPQAALRVMFGETLEGPLAEILVRNWSVLVTLVGVMLMWGAFKPQVRSMALVLGGASKLAFIGLVLAYGRHYLGQQVAIALAIDVIWVVLFAWYLLGARSARA
jgi:hypothetical protein